MALQNPDIELYDVETVTVLLGGTQTCDALDSIKAKYDEPRFAKNTMGGVTVQSRNRNTSGEIELALSPEDPANTFLWGKMTAKASFDIKSIDSAVPSFKVNSKQVTVMDPPEPQRGANHDTVRVWTLSASRLDLGDGPMPAPAV